ncbi:DUF2200 family protein [Saccharospirillum sp.]
MQKIRYLDKLIDELAKGKAMEKILRYTAERGLPVKFPEKQNASKQ